MAIIIGGLIVTLALVVKICLFKREEEPSEEVEVNEHNDRVTVGPLTADKLGIGHHTNKGAKPTLPLGPEVAEEDLWLNGLPFNPDPGSHWNLNSLDEDMNGKDPRQTNRSPAA